MDLDFGYCGGVVAVCAHFWGMEGRGVGRRVDGWMGVGGLGG